MTTIQALQDLYAALGGTASDVENINTIPAMLNALAEIAGSTIELPAVSSTDNGDILTVVEGKWAKAEAPEELPAVTTSDEGDALIVDSEGKWAKSAIPSQLPAVTSADAGDALIVDSEGKWAKGEAGRIHFIDVYTSVGNITDNATSALNISFGTGKTMGDIYTEALQHGIENTALRVHGSQNTSEIIMRPSGYNNSSIRYTYLYVNSDTNVYIHDLAINKDSTETNKSPRFRSITA